jgi:hypothetical protein
MKALIEGMIVSNKLDRNQKGENYRNIQIMQVSDNEDAELIRVKDFDLSYDAKGSLFRSWCNINVWSLNGKSGASIKVLEHVQADVVQMPFKKTDVK